MQEAVPQTPQTTQAAPPAVPQAPTTAIPGGVLTRQQLSQMRARRSELSDQLVSATNRREELVKQLHGTEGIVRTGLLDRIEVLDERIVNIEQDLAATGRILTDNAVQIPETRPPQGSPVQGLSQGGFVAISIVSIVLVFFPVAVAFSRWIWRRSRVPAPPANSITERRLERIEEAVDTIAIEVERISESQRFSARLLSEGPASAIAQSRAGERVEAQGFAQPPAGLR
ncbi:MAG: hypothetical protein ACT4OZ_15695 [Gemmatimonadota bacterium]